MVEAAEITADAQTAHRALERVASAFGRQASLTFEVLEAQLEHNRLLAELADEIDLLLAPEPAPANQAA